MSDSIVEEAILFRCSKLIKDTATRPTGFRFSSWELRTILQETATTLINDSNVTITTSFITPKDSY